MLNSSVATVRFRFIGKLLGGGVYEYYENTVSKLLVPRRAPGSKDHDTMVGLVTRRAEAEAELRSTRIKAEQELMQVVVQRLDRKIDDHVAKLFGLTREDVALISETLIGAH